METNNCLLAHTGVITSGTSNTVTKFGMVATTLGSANSYQLTAMPFSQSFNLTPPNIIMQNKVAVFQVVRDEDDKIIKTEFIKELWVETKNGVSVEFQVARDKDLAEYDASELAIRVISTVSF